MNEKKLNISLIIFYIFMVLTVVSIVLFFSKPTEGEAEKLTTEKEIVNLRYGETYQAEVQGESSNNKLIWSSSNPELVTVDSNGNIKAASNKDGTVIITATTPDGKSQISITVTIKRVDELVKVTGVTLNKKEVTLKYGEDTKINANITPSNATNKTIYWSSDNETLVKVDSNGNVKAIANKDGSAIITAKTADGNKTASVKINVKSIDDVIKVNGIRLSKKEVTLKYGETTNVTATISPSNATNKNVTWTSSNKNLVTVDSNGNIKAVANKAGSVTITAKTTDGGKTATVKVTVKEVTNSTGSTTAPDQAPAVKVTGITLNKKEVTLKYGETTKITATISPSNATNKKVTWSSSNKNLVTVDSNGNIKAVANKAGSATITVKTAYGEKTATVKVTVKAVTTTVKVTGVTVTANKAGSLYLNKQNGNVVTLTANISPSNATNKTVTWTSSNSTIATVDSTGKVTGKTLGEATITATTKDGSHKATYKVVVKQKNIIVITASAGKRMYDYFKSYNSSSNYKYNLSDGTLKYVYESGSGFDFQYGKGLTLAKEFINQKYKSKKNYIELSVFFTLTGNSVNKMTCTEINKSSEYTNFAAKYNNAIKEIINLGYKNTKGYVISHSPLNSKEAVNKFADKNKSWKIVYSTKTEACYAGYRSARKYWYSNKKMESVIATGKYSNLTFIDNYSNFVVPNDSDAKHYTWLKDYYKTTDGLHWDERTTKSYMQLAFDTAGM